MFEANVLNETQRPKKPYFDEPVENLFFGVVDMREDETETGKKYLEVRFECFSDGYEGQTITKLYFDEDPKTTEDGYYYGGRLNFLKLCDAAGVTVRGKVDSNFQYRDLIGAKIIADVQEKKGSRFFVLKNERQITSKVGTKNEQNS